MAIKYYKLHGRHGSTNTVFWLVYLFYLSVVTVDLLTNVDALPLDMTKYTVRWQKDTAISWSNVFLMFLHVHGL